MDKEVEMVQRDTDIITLEQIGTEFLRPERLRLQLAEAGGRKSPLDIGSFAYCKRGKTAGLDSDKGIPVIESSLVKSRRKLIINLLDSFLGFRGTTVLLRFRLFEGVVNWLNENGYMEVFSDPDHASSAYVGYTDYLNELLLKERFSSRHANALQKAFQKLIELQLPEDYKYVIRCAVLISPERSSTRPPRVSDVQMFKDTCLAIGRRYSEFLLKNEHYPCVVKIRDYEVVRFPSKSGTSGPFTQCAACYNADALRISTIDEYFSRLVEKRRDVNLGNIRFDLKKVQVNFDAANTNRRCYDRILMAVLAAKAYAALILLITGASPTELEQFKYEDALELASSSLKKELVAIKFRAGGKKAGYVIGRKEGLHILKEYLKLREWILDGQYVDSLFFTVSSKGGEFGRVFSRFYAATAMQTFYSSISGVFLDPTFPNITSRKVRKHKSNTEHSARFDPEVVAQSLNHTKAVNLAVYSEATIEQQETEFGTYWESVRHAAQMVRERSEAALKAGTSTASGHCEVFNLPRAVCDAGTVVIEPNCRTQYGCLYCAHYICHSDQEDIHKVLSLHYVINVVRDTAGDSSHAESLYKDLCIRIEFVLDAIAARSEVTAKMVAETRGKVFELGVLTPFWERRLQRFEKMGVVF
ncbi:MULTISPECIES: hypothetical protein [Pseudomonas]|uniref:hypothetical protein n=1 Tax=Pseudomonas TaxID=286 RepID=UPI003F95FE1F